MRSREQIEKQLLRADDIDSFSGGSDIVSQELVLEVLLDIRDLLMPKPVRIQLDNKLDRDIGKFLSGK